MDPESPGDFCTMPPGGVGVEKDLITIDEDGYIIISPRASAEDILAFVLGCIRDKPDISVQVKNTLGEALDLMDTEAMEKDAFADSPMEKQHIWTLLNGLFIDRTTLTKQ